MSAKEGPAGAKGRPAGAKVRSRARTASARRAQGERAAAFATSLPEGEAHAPRDGVRVAPVAPGTRPELAAIEAAIAAERGRVSLLYQVLLNSAPLADGWEKLLTAVRNRSSVPADLRELIILRVAACNRAPYEFAAHVPHARNAGVSDATVEALRTGASLDAFTPRERVVLALTDAMTQDVQVDDATMAPVTAGYEPRAVVEIVATVAAYNMVSRFLEALRIGH